MALKRKIQKLDEKRSVSSTSHNPVQDMELFNSTEYDFLECRWTPDRQISLIDGVAEAFGCSKKEAHQKVTRYTDEKSSILKLRYFKFPGARQRYTPVVHFHEFMEICSQLPGARAKAMRKEQAQIVTRALAGDDDLVRAILAQKDRLSVKLRAMLMKGLLSSEDTKAINGFRALEDANAKLVAEKKSTLLNHQLEVRNAKRAASRVRAKFEDQKSVVMNLRAQAEIQSQKAFDAAIVITELQNTLEQVQRQLNVSIFELNRIQDAGTALYEQYKIGMATLQQIAGDGTEPESGPVGPSAEQPRASSKPTRYIGLHDVTSNSSGEHNRLIRDINRDTLDSIGQNLSKYFSLTPSTTNAAKVAMVESIVGYVFPTNESHSFVSSVTCRTVIYSAVKARWKLVHSTYCTIGVMYDIVVRANDWARQHNLSGEFIMCQQRDLELLLGKRRAPSQVSNARVNVAYGLQQSTMLQHFSPVMGLLHYAK